MKMEIDNKNIEHRFIELNTRDIEESRHIEGYAAVFNSYSVDLGGFTEIISQGAFDGVIERSDVLCLLDHNQDRGILARSRQGSGSLALSIDEKGLKFGFDAPHTQLGDEVVEGLKRNDYNACSFAFTVESDTWEHNEDGSYIRTINKIGNLYDCSIVGSPAYPDTSVALRSLDKFKADEAMDAVLIRSEEEDKEDEEPKDEEQVEETPKEEEPKEEEPKEEEPKEEEEEKSEEDEKGEEPKDDKQPEEQEETEPKDERNYNTNKKIVHMNNFSLIKTINDIVNNRGISDDSMAVIEMGAQEMRKSGLNYGGQIQLPVEERSNEVVATVATDGQEIVATDKLDILGPLRGKSIISECTLLTGLVGNISIPVYDGTTCGWKGEIASADNGKGEFSSVELSPKRLTAYIDISKQFLAQDSVGAEDMLRADIVNALSAKLEKTIFGADAGDATKPEGIFNGATALAPSYAGACDAEAALADVTGDIKYIMAPNAKSTFKQTTVSGSKSDLRMLCENNEVNGYPVVSSSNVVAGGYAVGDFKELVVGQWGAIDLTVDPYTRATDNVVRLVISAFFDAKLRRSGAVVVNTLA